MLSTTVDDFYLSSIDKQIEDIFFQYKSSVFYITSPSDTIKIDFLSLQIYRSKFGTSLDQTHHIYKNILSGYFEPGHTTKNIDTPIQVEPTFEHDLANIVHLYHLKSFVTMKIAIKVPTTLLLGSYYIFSNGPHPDLNYAISRLAVFIKAPTGLAFEALHHLLQYLCHHIHEPIFYPSHKLSSEDLITYHWCKDSCARVNNI